MKVFLTLAVMALSLPAFAKQAQITCKIKAYACYQTNDGRLDCRWRTTGTLPTAKIPLFQDKDFPNPENPFEVWYTDYAPIYDGHQLHLRVIFKQGKNSSQINLRGRLQASDVMAETTGTRSLDISLRNDSFGRGFYCPSVEVIP